MENKIPNWTIQNTKFISLIACFFMSKLFSNITFIILLQQKLQNTDTMQIQFRSRHKTLGIILCCSRAIRSWRLWISSSSETLPSPWVTCASVQPLSQWKKKKELKSFSLMLKRKFLYLSLCTLPLSLGTTRVALFKGSLIESLQFPDLLQIQ